MVRIAYKLTSFNGVGYSVLQCNNVISPPPLFSRTLIAAKISSGSHMPVDITTGFPVCAILIKYG